MLNITKNSSIFKNLKPRQKKALIKNNNILRKITKTRNCNSLKTLFKKVPTQKGGWASLILPILTTVIPAIISLFKKKH